MADACAAGSIDCQDRIDVYIIGIDTADGVKGHFTAFRGGPGVPERVLRRKAGMARAAGIGRYSRVVISDTTPLAGDSLGAEKTELSPGAACSQSDPGNQAEPQKGQRGRETTILSQS